MPCNTCLCGQLLIVQLDGDVEVKMMWKCIVCLARLLHYTLQLGTVYC